MKKFALLLILPLVVSLVTVAAQKKEDSPKRQRPSNTLSLIRMI